ncbi:rab family gtpase [Stylonychia lemnae]|uniref:Rab family gtpase n=1 Tax=Stylonychia lemnae TaxID=5949 RepID=A0A078B2P5_STYLE|nr:rab family gtpase [Stylonychia lemnae]|eukprot:CDW88749.1 rab family gtpase [Stylonychia lemnae]
MASTNPNLEFQEEQNPKNKLLVNQYVQNIMTESKIISRSLRIFDVTNRGSFEVVSKYLKFVKEYAIGDPMIVLCGNKCDVQSNPRKVNYEEGMSYALSNKIGYIELSARWDWNIWLLHNLSARTIAE